MQTVSHWLHPIAKSSLESAWVINDYVWIQAVALHITYKKLMKIFMLKMISFLQFHIAQSSAHSPIWICPAISDFTPVSHVPNNISILIGGLTLKTICIVRQSSLARGQSRSKCFMVSFWSQKQHHELPTYLRFIKLFFVKITSLCTNMKIFILNETLTFHVRPFEPVF